MSVSFSGTFWLPSPKLPIDLEILRNILIAYCTYMECFRSPPYFYTCILLCTLRRQNRHLQLLFDSLGCEAKLSSCPPWQCSELSPAPSSSPWGPSPSRCTRARGRWPYCSSSCSPSCSSCSLSVAAAASSTIVCGVKVGDNCALLSDPKYVLHHNVSRIFYSVN